MMNTDVSQYPMLREDQRIAAREVARGNHVKKIARKPERSEFADYTASRYPRWFTGAAMVALLVIGIAAALISSFRIYYAGARYFSQTLPNETMAAIVGGATFLAAELLVIVATVLARIYLRGRTQAVMLPPVLIGLAVAFVGNWYIARPDSVWGWLDTVFPPLAVLSVAFFFELALMPELERREANERAYQDALQRYQLAIADPEKHPEWVQSWANALWDAWRSGKRRDLLGRITSDEQRAIVLREMRADNWFQDEISRNSEKRQGGAGVNQRQVVIDYLKRIPGDVSRNQADLAEFLDVSTATVNRAIKDYKAHSQNGNGGEGK